MTEIAVTLVVILAGVAAYFYWKYSGQAEIERRRRMKTEVRNARLEEERRALHRSEREHIKRINELLAERDKLRADSES